MTSLSVNNLITSIGIAFDTQIKASDNLFFAAAVDFTDPTKPMFGGAVGNAAGQATTLYPNDQGSPTGYASTNNAVSGDPVTVRQITTADGPRYQVTDNNGREIKVESQSLSGATALYQNVPRYLVKADGIVYDVLASTTSNMTGAYGIYDPSTKQGIGPQATAGPAISTINISTYGRAIGRITFKAKEGATLARAQDDQQRAGQVVQLLTRLLESIQDESKGFSSLIR
ncbi:MAG: hypothetical protein H7263_17810 [Candidatus Sericytochromatia bacterium]|nr:hypothetical protein [Candidatus Sericytochromatia bacterium]